MDELGAIARGLAQSAITIKASDSVDGGTCLRVSRRRVAFGKRDSAASIASLIFK